MISLLIILFTILSWKKPQLALITIIFLPIFGEFGRLTAPIINRDLLAVDIFLPIFTSVFIAKQIISQQFHKFFTKKSEFIFLIFIAVAIFSNLLAFSNFTLGENLESNLYLFRLIQYFLLFPITKILLQNNSIKPKTILYSLFAASFLISTIGFLQLQFLPDLKELAEEGYDPHIDRLVSSWLDPNYIGGYLSFITILILGKLFDSKPPKTKLLLAALAIFNITAIFLTYSRSGYLALASGLFLIGLIKSRKLILILTFVFLIGISVSDRARERTGELLQSINSVLLNSNENPDPTARLRIENFETTIKLIEQKPLLGHGYNTLKPTKQNQGIVKSSDDHAASGSDSSLLGILATTGIIGATAFIYHLILLLKTTFPLPLNPSLLKRNKKSPQTTQKTAIFAATISLLIHSIFVNSLLFPFMLIPFYISHSLLTKTNK